VIYDSSRVDQSTTLKVTDSQTDIPTNTHNNNTAVRHLIDRPRWRPTAPNTHTSSGVLFSAQFDLSNFNRVHTTSGRAAVCPSSAHARLTFPSVTVVERQLALFRIYRSNGIPAIFDRHRVGRSAAVVRTSSLSVQSVHTGSHRTVRFIRSDHTIPLSDIC